MSGSATSGSSFCRLREMLIYRVTISDNRSGRPFCHFETPKKYDALRYKERAEALRQHVEITERHTTYDPV